MLTPGGRTPFFPAPMRITERTRAVLEAVAAEPGLSNRALAQRVGIGDAGQVSRLLARLRQLGLVANDCEGRGSANAWRLTLEGAQTEALARRQRAWRAPLYGRG